VVEVFRFIRKGRYFGNFINEKIFFSKFRVNKYQLNKMMPVDAVQNKIDYYKEELKQSRETHAIQVRDYRDLEGNDDQQNNQEIFAGQYQEDIRGNLHLIGQLKNPATHPSKPQELKNPATHPSKPQELKNPATYPTAPVSAQSIKNDAVISRGRVPPTPRELEASSKSKNAL